MREPSGLSESGTVIHMLKRASFRVDLGQGENRVGGISVPRSRLLGGPGLTCLIIKSMIQWVLGAQSHVPIGVSHCPCPPSQQQHIINLAAYINLAVFPKSDIFVTDHVRVILLQ